MNRSFSQFKATRERGLISGGGGGLKWEGISFYHPGGPIRGGGGGGGGG